MSNSHVTGVKKESVGKRQEQIKNIHAKHLKKLEQVANEYKNVSKEAEELHERYRKLEVKLSGLGDNSISASVAISDIDTSQNDRKVDEESTDFIALKESIESDGLLQRPVLTLGAHPKQPFLCVAGHRRIYAMKLLGHEEVPVSLIRPRNDQSTKILRLTENVVRQNLKPLDLADAVYALKNELRESTVGVSRILNKNRSYITRLLKIAQWPPEAKEIARDNNLSSFVLDKLAQKSLSNEILVEMLLQFVKSGRLSTTEKSDRLSTTPKISKFNQNKIKNYFSSKNLSHHEKNLIMSFLKENEIKGWYGKSDEDFLN